MTLRILYVSHSFPPPGRPEANVGGMQRMATELQAALAAHPEVELHSLLLETSWEQTHGRMAGFYLRLLRDIPRIVRRERIDVVLFSSVVTASTAVALHPLVHRLGARLATIAVGRDVTLPVPLHQWWVRQVLRSADLVLPISRATAAECRARGVPEERLEIVPCGAEVERFADGGERCHARAALLREFGGEAPPDALLLCSVGRHQERKGFHWFIREVLPRLPADMLYLLAGDGPMTEPIRDAVRSAGVEDRVRLLGQVPERMLGTLYRGADLFVMPNVPVEGDIEGFGVVMLEAGLCGLPVVAAELEGIRDVVVPGENGTLVPSGDAAAFAEAILRFRGTGAACETSARRVARFTARCFGWPAVAERYVRVLREAAG